MIFNNILNQYFKYDHIILLVTLSIQIVLITIGIIYTKKKDIKIKCNSLIENICLSIFIIIISWLLSMLNLDFKNNVSYFNILLFCVITFIVFICMLYQIIKYKNILDVTYHYVKYFRTIIWIEFFILGSTKNLQLLELANGLFAICLLEFLHFIVANTKVKAQENRPLECDWPTDELYDTREKQLKRFLSMISQQKSEPYAIMISGEWGLGKTSFVKALQKKLSDDIFIWIKAGGEKNASEIMKDISNEIINVLKTNDVYLEKSGLIDEYFLSFTEMLDQAGWGFFNKIIDILGFRDEKTNTQEYVNNKLKHLGKTIFLVIDDLDRCDNEYRMKMFKVIRESTMLNNCKTIFLADYSMFLDKNCDVNYIEKYVSYNLKICNVDYEEIVLNYIEEIFNADFISEIKPEILQNKSLDYVQQDILNYSNNVLESLMQHKANMNNSPEENATFDTIIKHIRKNTSNSRKVKNFLKDVKADFMHLNTIWGNSTNEYKTGLWYHVTLKVQFIKHFLPNSYMQLLEYSNIEDYLEHCDIAMQSILQINTEDYWASEKEREMYNFALYAFDTLDFAIDKTEQQKYMDELYGKTPNILHYEIYLKHIWYKNIVDYEKMLQLYDENLILSHEDNVKFFTQFLDKISFYPTTLSDDFLELSKHIIHSINLHEWSKKEISIWKNYAKDIVQKYMSANSLLLKEPLYIFHGYKRTEQVWPEINLPDIDSLCDIIESLDPVFTEYQHIYKSRPLTRLQLYYKRLRTYILSANNKMPDIDYDNLFARCDLCLELLTLWTNAFPLNRANRKNESFEHYFDMNMFTWKESVFNSPETLKKALDSLNTFYESKENEYNSNYSKYLYNTVKQMLKTIINAPNWFNGEEYDLARKIYRIADKVCLLDSAETITSKNIIDGIKILMHEFKKHSNM